MGIIGLGDTGRKSAHALQALEADVLLQQKQKAGAGGKRDSIFAAA